jgi:hypothetical protein
MEEIEGSRYTTAPPAVRPLQSRRKGGTNGSKNGF